MYNIAHWGSALYSSLALRLHIAVYGSTTQHIHSSVAHFLIQKQTLLCIMLRISYFFPEQPRGNSI